MNNTSIIITVEIRLRGFSHDDIVNFGFEEEYLVKCKRRKDREFKVFDVI